ncbi:hypothetical protein [Niveibacterium sp. COAC-50]|uniref:hypothetical protein n=1 Tax=Niveibacterium sp. COAC-50 TaxID=2729384 RepID=UPI00155575F5|nr:hypothetical protein [Niveibacterium sp. COAC-50]
MDTTARFGYRDFIKLCRVTDPENWEDCFSVRGDGVYVREHQGILTPAEREAISEHPTGNLKEPALPFPCSLVQFQVFLERQRLYPYVDPFDMLEWALARSSPPSASAKSASGSAVVQETLLVLVATLCDYKGIDHKERGAARRIAKMTEEFGVPVSDDTVRRVLERIPNALENRQK